MKLQGIDHDVVSLQLFINGDRTLLLFPVVKYTSFKTEKYHKIADRIFVRLDIPFKCSQNILDSRRYKGIISGIKRYNLIGAIKDYLGGTLKSKPIRSLTCLGDLAELSRVIRSYSRE